MTRSMCWYQQVKINNPRGFVEERKFDWDLKIEQSQDGALDDGALMQQSPNKILGLERRSCSWDLASF